MASDGKQEGSTGTSFGPAPCGRYPPGRTPVRTSDANLIWAVLDTKLPGSGSIYLDPSLKFLKPVRIGDTVEATVEVIRFTAKNEIVN